MRVRAAPRSSRVTTRASRSGRSCSRRCALGGWRRCARTSAWSGSSGREGCNLIRFANQIAVPMIDLTLTNARTLDGALVDLFVDGGRFVSGGEPRRVIDVEGRLVTPPLVDCHLHLDASLTVGRPCFNESGTLIEGIHVWGELKPSLTEQDVFERASEIVRWSAAQGTLFIRAHADVSGENEAMVRGLLRVRDELADLCTIQVTAFPQDGIFARDGDEERLENAIRLGVDCVGGIPHYEPTAELGLREVHRVFELAKQHSRRVDVHCDETDDPSSRFLEVMADDTVKVGLAGAWEGHPLHRGGLVRAVLLVEAARLSAPRRDQRRRQPVRELAHPGPPRRLPEAPRLRAAEGAARRGRQRLARQ